MYQFWCSWEILLTVAVIPELRLKLEGGGKPSSFEALLSEFTLHPDSTSTYHLSSTYFALFFVYYLIMTAFWIDKPYILFIVEKNLRMPIFIIFQYKYIS